MAANDRYRERMGLDDDARDENAELVAPLTAALEALRASGNVSVDAVQGVLQTAELANVQVREDYGRVLFGASGPAGGCLFGEVAAGSVSVEVGGFILDGGCLPMQ